MATGAAIQDNHSMETQCPRSLYSTVHRVKEKTSEQSSRPLRDLPAFLLSIGARVQLAQLPVLMAL